MCQIGHPRDENPGFRHDGGRFQSKCLMQGIKFRVQASGFMIQGLRFRVLGLRLTQS